MRYSGFGFEAAPSDAGFDYLRLGLDSALPFEHLSRPFHEIISNRAPIVGSIDEHAELDADFTESL